MVNKADQDKGIFNFIGDVAGGVGSLIGGAGKFLAGPFERTEMFNEQARIATESRQNTLRNANMQKFGQIAQAYDKLPEGDPIRQRVTPDMITKLGKMWGLTPGLMEIARGGLSGQGAFGGIPSGFVPQRATVGAEGQVSTGYGPPKEREYLDELGEAQAGYAEAKRNKDPIMMAAYEEDRNKNPLWQTAQTRLFPESVKKYFKTAKQNVSRTKWDKTFSYKEAADYFAKTFPFIPEEVRIAELNKHWDAMVKEEKGPWHKYGPRPSTKPEAAAAGRATEDNVGRTPYNGTETPEVKANRAKGLRADGSKKGPGWDGEWQLTGKDGRSGIATEFSRGSEVNGKFMEYPLIVPDLTDSEKAELKGVIEGNGKKVPASVEKKALKWAEYRESIGKSPFRNAGEQLNANRKNSRKSPPAEYPDAVWSEEHGMWTVVVDGRLKGIK